MIDLWAESDLPVLVELVQRLEVEGAHRVDTPLHVGDLTEPQIQGALRRLEDGGYIVGVSTQMRYPVVITGVTERARRAVGAWPSAESLTERLLTALTDVAEHGETPEARTRARRLLDAVGQDGRGILIGALGSALGSKLLGM